MCAGVRLPSAYINRAIRLGQGNVSTRMPCARQNFSGFRPFAVSSAAHTPNVESIVSKTGPVPIGPYVHATKAAGTVYTSGVLGIVPEEGRLVEGIEAQTSRALQTLTGVLEASGTSKDRVLKCTVFLKDLGDFGAMNKVYEAYFAPHKPARTCFQVSKLPLDGLVEIEAVALA